jgi:hypothetical protein
MGRARRGLEKVRRRRQRVFRAVTLGPGEEDWGVVHPDGRIVYRGLALHAARMASRMNAA